MNIYVIYPQDYIKSKGITYFFSLRFSLLKKSNSLVLYIIRKYPPLQERFLYTNFSTYGDLWSLRFKLRSTTAIWSSRLVQKRIGIHNDFCNWNSWSNNYYLLRSTCSQGKISPFKTSL